MGSIPESLLGAVQNNFSIEALSTRYPWIESAVVWTGPSRFPMLAGEKAA
jgi:uncharacterized protein (DUF433 family)